MKHLLLSLLPFAALACSLPQKETAREGAPATAPRRVAQATGGHGSQVAVSASEAAAAMTSERSVTTSVFPPEEPGKPLRGNHRCIAASTGGHGSVVIAPAAPDTGKGAGTAAQ